MRPPLRARAQRDLGAEASRSPRSRRSASGLGAGSPPDRGVAAVRIRRTSSSVCRTDSPRAITAPSMPAARARQARPIARACPSLTCPASERLWTSGELEQAKRVRDGRAARPTRWRDLLMLSPNSSIRRRNAWASSSAFRSVRWRFSISAQASWAASSARRGRRPGCARGRPSPPRAGAARRRSADSPSALR